MPASPVDSGTAKVRGPAARARRNGALAVAAVLVASGAALAAVPGHASAADSELLTNAGFEVAP